MAKSPSVSPAEEHATVGFGMFSEASLENDGPVIDTSLPTSEWVRAHEIVYERTHFGKVILVNNE